MTYVVKAIFRGYEQSSDMKERIKAMSEEEWAEIGRSLLDDAAWPKHKDVIEREYWSMEAMLTIEDVIRLQDRGFKIEVGRIKGLDYSNASPSEMLKVAKHEAAQVHIHVAGGVSLTSMTQVTWEEDCCTQHLQAQLDEGWRIIAVCPPNDARRPTYILGK